MPLTRVCAPAAHSAVEPAPVPLYEGRGAFCARRKASWLHRIERKVSEARAARSVGAAMNPRIQSKSTEGAETLQRQRV